jgi:hypothetical protein
MPKILRDTQKDCGKPGCLNDNRIQVLAGGDEMIEQERRLPPLALFSDLQRCPRFGCYRGQNGHSAPALFGSN